MAKSNSFLFRPGVIDDILDAMLTGGLETAVELGANCGAVAAAFIIEGELHLKARALCGDVAQASDLEATWENDPNVGLNPVGYAIGKIMQAMRLDAPSAEGKALGYGESDCAGAAIERCQDWRGKTLSEEGRAHEDNMEIVDFRMISAYSGMTPEKDFIIGREANREGWFKMSGYKEGNGENVLTVRACGGCR